MGTIANGLQTDCGCDAGAPDPIARILYAEDDPVLRGLVVSMLCRDGHAVVQAENGLRAWAALHLHAFDLLITDNDMPEMTGLQLILAARSEGMKLPIIMTSSFAESLCGGQDALGFAKPLSKPFTWEELSRAVADALGIASTMQAPASPPL